MPAMARAGPGGDQEAGIPADSPTWVAGTQVLGHYQLLSQAHYQDLDQKLSSWASNVTLTLENRHHKQKLKP